jgi:hypothetical protein
MLCWLVVIFYLHSVISYKFERSFKGATTLSTCVLLTSGGPWSKTGLSCVSSLRFRILGCDVPLMSVRSCLGSCWWRKCLPPYMFGVWYVDAFVYLCWWLFSRADFCDFILLLYLWLLHNKCKYLWTNFLCCFACGWYVYTFSWIWDSIPALVSFRLWCKFIVLNWRLTFSYAEWLNVLRLELKLLLYSDYYPWVKLLVGISYWNIIFSWLLLQISNWISFTLG